MLDRIFINRLRVIAIFTEVVKLIIKSRQIDCRYLQYTSKQWSAWWNPHQSTPCNCNIHGSSKTHYKIQTDRFYIFRTLKESTKFLTISRRIDSVYFDIQENGWMRDKSKQVDPVIGCNVTLKIYPIPNLTLGFVVYLDFLTYVGVCKRIVGNC